MTLNDRTDNPIASRRSFFKGGGLILAGGAVGCGLTLSQSAHAGGTDAIKIGLIGAGGRGTSLVDRLLASDRGMTLTAIADVFDHQVQSSLRTLIGKHPDQVNAARMVGLTGYETLLQTDVDAVILATPPGFRPLHFEHAVRSGKHVFMEKPIAVDAPGVRRVVAAGREAAKRSLAVQVGLQRRHDAIYQACVNQIQSGAIGRPIYGRVYWNTAGMWNRPRRRHQSELEYQLSNWYYFNWLSGDHLVEQHIHNLDVINWALDSRPMQAQGQGGREVRRDATVGQIYDHHTVEYLYSNQFRLIAQCRHMPGCWSDVGEHLHGTEGVCNFADGTISDADGRVVWNANSRHTLLNDHRNLPSVTQTRSRLMNDAGTDGQLDAFTVALRRGVPVNDVDSAATSTMTAIMGRMATYSGKVITWDQAYSSNLSLADVDSLVSFDSHPPVIPRGDGTYESPVPGRTRVL